MPAQPSRARLEKLLKHLENAQSFHLEVGLKMSQTGSGAIWPVDLLANGVLNRSANLVDGFIILVRKRNFICCAPLLRLQIDNCLRFYAVYLVKDCHQFAVDVLQGTPVSKIKDRNGKPMTDKYLAEKLNEKHPWILRVYKRTSGYVHLSNTHIFSTVDKTSEEMQARGILNFKIGRGDNFEDDELYEKAVSAFIETTKVLFNYLIGWIKTKDGLPKSKMES